MVAMPTVASEVALIEAFADTKVIGITLNHEQMDDAEITATIQELEHALGIPVTDPLTRPLERLVDMVLLAFPALSARSEEHTSELQSLMRISYAVFCLKNTKNI